MREYGFWVYVDPFCGGVCDYQKDDWEILLDDMAGGGMNSLVICLRNKLTPYKSKLPYLDQILVDHPIMKSGNALLRDVIKMAHKRNIKIWLMNNVNVALCDIYGVAPPDGAAPNILKGVPPFGGMASFKYDIGLPIVAERAVEIAKEMVELFGEADGIVIETENGYKCGSHRLDAYNRWATEQTNATGKIHPTYDALSKQYPNPRTNPDRYWREYVTDYTCGFLKGLEREIKSAGYKGELGFIIESLTEASTYQLSYDLDIFKRNAPENTACVFYDYFRWVHRLAVTDFCMRYPKQLGLPTYFLGRGLLNFPLTYSQPLIQQMPVSLQEHWRMDFEDALSSNVDGLWFYEADVKPSGMYVDIKDLKDFGFKDGMDARRQLLTIGKSVGAPGRLTRTTTEATAPAGKTRNADLSIFEI